MHFCMDKTARRIIMAIVFAFAVFSVIFYIHGVYHETKQEAYRELRDFPIRSRYLPIQKWKVQWHRLSV